MSPKRVAWLVLVVATLPCGAAVSVKAQPPAEPPTQPPAEPRAYFSEAEEKARQAVLDSDDWKDACERFDRWLTIQIAYDPAELATMKENLQARIANMNADQLRAFLAEMQQRLDVLLSQDVSAARNWADAFYTKQGQRELIEKYNVADPISLSADQLAEALHRFAADRQSQSTGQAAFERGQAAQVAAVAERQRAERAAAAASAARRPASYPSPYAPKRSHELKRYRPAYDPVRYSIGPWGGVWVGF